MNLISDILFWISNGLLVPVVVLLIVLFIRSLLLIAVFSGNIWLFGVQMRCCVNSLMH